MHPLLLTLFVAAPPPSLLEIDGSELLDEVRRSSEPLVLINVWATWCSPCVKELPMLFELEKQLAGKVRFMFVSADFKSERSSAAKLFTAKGAKLPGFFRRGPDQAFIETLHPKWTGTIPATFVFDRAGKLLEFWQGELTEKHLLGALEGMLGKNVRAPD